MTAIIVPSSEFADSPRERTSTLAINGIPVPRRTPLTPSGVLVRDESGIVTMETKVVVEDGIADVEPSILDFDPCQSIESDSDAWYRLEAAVDDANCILSSLDECNPPSLDDRFRLHVAMQRIRKGADALEGHIARNGLWLSDEWCDCDSTKTWHHF